MSKRRLGKEKQSLYDTDILVYPNKMDGGELDKDYFKNKQ